MLRYPKTLPVWETLPSLGGQFSESKGRSRRPACDVPRARREPHLRPGAVLCLITQGQEPQGHPGALKPSDTVPTRQPQPTQPSVPSPGNPREGRGLKSSQLPSPAPTRWHPCPARSSLSGTRENNDQFLPVPLPGLLCGRADRPSPKGTRNRAAGEGRGHEVPK